MGNCLSVPLKNHSSALHSWETSPATLRESAPLSSSSPQTFKSALNSCYDVNIRCPHPCPINVVSAVLGGSRQFKRLRPGWRRVTRDSSPYMYPITSSSCLAIIPCLPQVHSSPLPHSSKHTGNRKTNAYMFTYTFANRQKPERDDNYSMTC